MQNLVGAEGTEGGKRKFCLFIKGKIFQNLVHCALAILRYVTIFMYVYDIHFVCFLGVPKLLIIYFWVIGICMRKMMVTTLGMDDDDDDDVKFHYVMTYKNDHKQGAFGPLPFRTPPS